MTVMALWRLCIITLFVFGVYGQRTPSNNAAVPSTSLDGIAITPLVSGRTERVPPCGLRIFSFQPTARSRQFHVEVQFTALSSVSFVASLLPSAPGGQVGQTVADVCDAANHMCTVKNAGQRCSLIEGCGGASQDSQATWFVVVKTKGLTEGFFQLEAFANALGDGDELIINQTPEGQVSRVVSGRGKKLADDPINQYDFFYFDIPVNETQPRGTVLRIDLVPTNPVEGKLTTYLNYGDNVAFPDYNCHSFKKNLGILPACEYKQGGRWHFTVVRSVEDQEYRVRLYETAPTILALEHKEKKQHDLLATEDEVYFLFSGLDEFKGKRVRMFAIVDNVRGGNVQLGFQRRDLPFLECSQQTTKQCATTEGCHVVMDPCDLGDDFKGEQYYLGVRAVKVDSKSQPLSFTVSIVVYEIETEDAKHDEPIVGELFQGQQAHYRMKVPTKPSGNWVNYNMYIDRSVTSLPASLYLSPSPFPGPNEASCTTNTKSCIASTTSSGITTCTIQLDPCELAAYPDGVYMSVIASSPNRGSEQHYWYQDTLSYTIVTELWNPNEEPLAITAGRVVTDHVVDTQYRIFRLVDFTGVLKISVSGNVHNTARDRPNTQELSVSIVYGPRIEGPSCGKCWNKEQTKVVRATQTETWTVPTCKYGNEGVFVVVRGLAPASGSLFNYRHNEFVLSSAIVTESFAGENTRELKEGQHSSEIAQTGGFGETEYWLLKFNRKDLLSRTLTIRLRAHPQTGRQIQLSIFSGQFDFSCGSGLPLVDSCKVDNENKGFCTITYQACFFKGNRDPRTFVVVVSGTARNVIDETSIDPVYDLSFELVDQDPTPLELETPTVVSVIRNVYTHLTLDVPRSAVGQQSLVIEAYFDHGQNGVPGRSLTLYGNSPAHGDKLAGRPSHGCYCNSFSATDTEKVVYIVDRCSLQSGRYHLSLFSEGLTFIELGSRVTINAYLFDFVTPLEYEFPADKSLYFGQTAIFQIEVDERMVNSLNRTDKELTITTTTNFKRHSASVQFSLLTVLADCFCGTLGDAGVPCIPKDGDAGVCKLQRDYCQLRPPGHYYIRATVVAGKGFDKRQPVPFTIHATKHNNHPNIIPLQVVKGCGRQNRLPVSVTTFVDGQELQFFRLEGLFGVKELLNVFLSNVTDGNVQVMVGSDFLPTTHCNAINRLCPVAPEGPDCVTQSVCTNQATHIAVKAESVNKNLPVKFRISTCYADEDDLEFGATTPISTTLNPGATTVFEFDMAGKLDAARTPAIVAKVSADKFIRGDRFTISLARSSCGACRAFGRTTRCTTQNCSLVIFFCDLPSDFGQSNWTLQIDNDRNQTTQDTTYFLQVFPVPVPDPIDITVDNAITRSVPVLNWVNIRWNLPAAAVLTATDGVQRSFIDVKALDANGARVEGFVNGSNADRLPGACPARLAGTFPQLRVVPWIVSECCTEPGVYQVLLFNRDFVNSASFQISAGLTTLARNTATVWDFVTDSAIVRRVDAPPSFVAKPGAFGEVLIRYPGSKVQKYSTLVVRVLHNDFRASKNVNNVKAFIREDGLAGDRACFGFDSRPVFTQGEAVYTAFACKSKRPHDLYVGVSNGNDIIERFDVEAYHINPIQLTADSFSQEVAGYLGVNQQFYLDLTASSAVNNIKIEVRVTSGRVLMFYSVDDPAGQKTKYPCARGTAPDVGGVSVASGDTFTRTLASCSLKGDRLYIGVEPATVGVSRFSVRVSYTNALSGETIVPITFGTKLENQRPAIYRGVVGNGFASNVTALRFTLSDLTNDRGGVPAEFRIDYFRDGLCRSSANSFCTRSSGIKKCSTIIPACELLTDSNYYFQVVQTAGSSAVTWSITPELIQLKPTFLPLPSQNSELIEEHSINSHDLHLYIYSFPVDSIKPGEFINVSLASEDCGDVLVYGNRGSSPGPGCSGVDNCDTAGCTLTTFSQCDLLTPGDNHKTDFWVLVRGRNQIADSPTQFKLRMKRTGGVVLKTLHSLELQNVFARATAIDSPRSCSAGRGAALPLPCCDVGKVPEILYSWKAEPAVFVYPINGANILGNDHQFRLTLDRTYAIAGKLSVWKQMPGFCNSGPRLADRPGLYDSCIASTANDRTCVVKLSLREESCRLAEAHQLFVTVDYVNLTDAKDLPSSDPTPFVVASVKHSQTPYEIIPVEYKDEPQYFQFTMTLNHFVYFKILHPAHKKNETLDIPPNYHFRATLLDVKGGSVTIWNQWGCEASAHCTDDECQDPMNNNECNKLLPDCQCGIDQLNCARQYNEEEESVFRLQASKLKDPLVNHVLGRIRFDFYDPLRPLVNTTCNSVRCGSALYYDAHSVDPGPEQIYRFRLTGVAGKTQLSINDGNIAPRLFKDAKCSRKRICSVSGSLSTCEILYRGPLVPYATVAPLADDDCADGTKKRFHLRSDFYTPRIQQLKNGVLHYSKFFEIDPETKCESPQESEYYRYDAQGGAYLYVEITTPGPERQVWMTPDHISHHIFGEEAEFLGCTIKNGQSNCHFVHACNYKAGRYFFQVSPGEHTITVTERDFIIKNIAVGQVVNLTLPTDHTQLVVFHVSPVSGRHISPKNDLEVYYSAGVPLDTWMTRSSFGDPRCSFSSKDDVNDGLHTVPSCQIAADDDTFNVHFLRRPQTVCVGSTITVRAKFTENAIVPTLPKQLYQIKDGETIYIKHNVGGLTSDEVVYGRVQTSSDDAVLRLKLFKGNHMNGVVDFALPCDVENKCESDSPYKSAVWLDHCWHCGDEETFQYNTVFSQVKVTKPDLNLREIPFTLTTEVVKWVELESTKWERAVWEGFDRQMAFYTAEMTREEALRIDLDVASGPGVEVAVYFANCSIREKTTPVVLWCFPGHRCEIPLDKTHNFGGFYLGKKRSSPFADGSHTMRIVVTGFASNFSIRYTRGKDTCEPLQKEDAPFCAEADLEKVLVSGSRIWFRSKDRKAFDQYQNFTTSFSCPQNDDCNCAPLSQKCLKYLKELSCELNFGPCDKNGFKKQPDYTLCKTVEHWCGKSFMVAALPEYHCNHNYYRNGVAFVEANGAPIHPLSGDIEGKSNGLATGWVVVIGLLILAAVLVALAMVYVMAKRSSRNEYSRLGEDDFTTQGYQQM